MIVQNKKILKRNYHRTTIWQLVEVCISNFTKPIQKFCCFGKKIQKIPQISFLRVLIPKLFSHLGKKNPKKKYGQDYYYNIYTNSKIIILFSGILKLSIFFKKQFCKKKKNLMEYLKICNLLE